MTTNERGEKRRIQTELDMMKSVKDKMPAEQLHSMTRLKLALKLL